MNSSYTVPIIPQNLSKHETIIQIAEVLNHLSNITEDIFQHVNKRIEVNNKNLSRISERVETVNTKINKLKGAKKATQVFSSSKYPASDIYREYVSVFSDVQPLELKRHKVKHKNFTSTYEPLDKLQFYHVKVFNNDGTQKLEGLGDIPTRVKYVNDLMLYNTGKNLYKNFVITDSLKAPQAIKEGDNLDASDIGAAPVSITERSSLTKSVTQTYFYTPRIGELPALDVPLDLPDLPGIADDLRYENEVGPGIAPSAVTENIFDNISDLPSVLDTEHEVKDIKIPDVNIPEPPQIEIPKPQPAPKIPEPDVNIVDKVKPEIPKPQISNGETSQKLPDIPIPVQPDVRASLMEAIRKAGGSKNAQLKSVASKDESKMDKAPGGDLMADLYSKLLLRRKGISGTKKPEQEGPIDSGSTFAKISAMIPPPPPKKEAETTSTDEEDWD